MTTVKWRFVEIQSGSVLERFSNWASRTPTQHCTIFCLVSYFRWEESFMGASCTMLCRRARNAAASSGFFSAEINSEEWPLGSLWVTPAAAIVKMQNCLLPKCKWEERVPYNNNQLVRHRRLFCCCLLLLFVIICCCLLLFDSQDAKLPKCKWKESVPYKDSTLKQSRVFSSIQ